ncbi:MAG: LacI family DNA-binding transcriptional regulator [Gaiellaceae bacterium]
MGFASEAWDLSTSPNGFLDRLVEGLKARARSSGCDVLLFTAIEARERAFVDRCEQNGVAGVVYHSFGPSEPRIRTLLEAGVPCMAVDAEGIAPRLGHVSSDNMGAATAAVRHLHDLGRRRIATMAVARFEDEHARLGTAGGERLLGYQAGLEQVGLPLREEYVVDSDWLRRGGMRAMERLLALDEPPDALFAPADVLAIAAMAVIEKAGLRVPEDIAVVGFDDVDYASLVTPGLTTMRQDAVGLGTASAEGLLRMIQHPPASPPQLRLPCELIVRESCGAKLAASRPPAPG